MSEILIKNKEIVVPGDELAKGMDFLPSTGTYRQGDFIIASKLGIINTDGRFVKVIPLSGKYFPKEGDTIIGEVKGMNFGGWMVKVNCAYLANLSIRDVPEYIERGAKLEEFYDFGDIFTTKITKVTRANNIDLSTKGPGFKKLFGGKIIKITPSKVPRVIGKNGSMVSLVKEYTGCKITVGQNGIVWVKGETSEDETLATNTIKHIEENSHTEGLTDKIKTLLEKQTKGKKIVTTNEPKAKAVSSINKKPVKLSTDSSIGGKK